MGPLAFLIVFNNVLPNFDNTFKFADELTLLNLCQTPNTLGVQLDSLTNNLKNDLDNVKLNLSIPKSSLMLFSFLKNVPPINNYLCIPNLNIVKLLGVRLDNDLKSKSHSFHLFKSGSFSLNQSPFSNGSQINQEP